MSGLYSDNKGAQIGITLTFSVLVTLDLIGNTLVILIIMTNKSMRTPMNFLLINLAIADIMVATFITPRFIFSHFFTHPDGLSGTLICKLFTGGNFTWTGGAGSVFSLVAIAFERYFAVMHPYSHKLKLTVQKVKQIVVACWIFAVVLNLPLFLTIFYDKKNNFCMEVWPKHPDWLAKAYSSVWFIVAGAVPITIMIILYSRVVYTLWFKRSPHDIEGTQLAVLRSRKRVTKMVVTVSIIYGLSWLPNLTIYALNYYHPGYTYGDVTYICSIVIVTCNSTINPFIYTFQSEKFRRHFKELVCCRKYRKNQVNVSTTGGSTHTTPKGRLHEESKVADQKL